MIHLLIVILNDLKRLPVLLQAWQTIGVPGMTMLILITFIGLGRFLFKGDLKIQL